MTDLLGVGVTRSNGGGTNGKETAVAAYEIPNFSITRYYHKSGEVGMPNEELELTVTQAGKDAAWALDIAINNEFSTFEEDRWICTKTVIIQIGMTV